MAPVLALLCSEVSNVVTLFVLPVTSLMLQEIIHAGSALQHHHNPDLVFFKDHQNVISPNCSAFIGACMIVI